VLAATGLWHWLQSWLMLATFSSRGFCEPCGVWQPCSLAFTLHARTPTTARLRVALGADRILIGGRLHVVRVEGAVRVVAVAALDQAFVHPVMERHGKRGFTSAWHWKQRFGCEAFSSFSSVSPL